MRVLILPADGFDPATEPKSEGRLVLLSYSKVKNEDGKAGWVASVQPDPIVGLIAAQYVILTSPVDLEAVVLASVWSCGTIRTRFTRGIQPFMENKPDGTYCEDWDAARDLAVQTAWPLPETDEIPIPTPKHKRSAEWAIVDTRTGQYYWGHPKYGQWGDAKGAVIFPDRDTAKAACEHTQPHFPKAAMLPVQIGPAGDN